MSKYLVRVAPRYVGGGPLPPAKMILNYPSVHRFGEPDSDTADHSDAEDSAGHTRTQCRNIGYRPPQRVNRGDKMIKRTRILPRIGTQRIQIMLHDTNHAFQLLFQVTLVTPKAGQIRAKNFVKLICLRLPQPYRLT